MELTREVRDERVAIATDVIEQIRNGNAQLRRRRYIHDVCLVDNLPDYGYDDPAQPHIDIIQRSCQTCALGSILLSFVRRHNRLSIGDILEHEGTNDPSLTLKDYFPKNELALIEAAFEENSIASFLSFTADSGERIEASRFL